MGRIFDGLVTLVLASRFISPSLAADTATQPTGPNPKDPAPTTEVKPLEEKVAEGNKTEEDKLFLLHKQLAETYFEKGDYKSATEHYGKASNAKPKDAKIMYRHLLSDALSGSTQYNFDTISDIIKLDPNMAKAYRLEQFLCEKRINELKKLESNDKGNYEDNDEEGGLYEFLESVSQLGGTTQERIERLRKNANEAYNKWLKLTVSPEAKEQYEKGQTAKEKKDYAKAEEFTRRALEISPNYAFALHNLGHVLVLQDRRKEAIETYTLALEQDPTRYDLWYDRGVNYFRLKMYREAWMDFNISNRLKLNEQAEKAIGLMISNNLVPKE